LPDITSCSLQLDPTALSTQRLEKAHPKKTLQDLVHSELDNQNNIRLLLLLLLLLQQ
jgi:hypothetical protein